MRKNTIIYLCGIVASMLASCSDEVGGKSDFLNGKDKTPLAVAALMDNSNAARTRAVDKQFEANDQLIAYLRHVTWNGNTTGARTVVLADKAPLLATFTKGSVEMTAYSGSDITPIGTGVALGLTSANTQQTEDLTASPALYWDDFSNSTSADTDLRTAGHYLQSYYGYCYNGGTPSTALTEAAGTLGWTVPYDQTSATMLKNSDLLWSAEQTPVPYSHATYDNGTPSAAHGQLLLPYTHAMSKITVVLKADKGYTTVEKPFERTKVIVNGVNKTCTTVAPTLTIQGEGQGTETGKEGQIDLFGGDYTSGSTRTYQAIFVPKTQIKEGDKLLDIIDVDGNSYSLTVTSNMLNSDAWGKNHTVETASEKSFIKTQSGINYKIEVTLSKQGISFRSTLSDWVTVNASGIGDILFEHDEDELVIEGDDGKPGTIKVEAVDKNLFKNGSSFSLFDLKAAEGNAEASARTNDKYDFVTVSSFSNPDDNEDYEDSWTNTPEIYWPNASDRYYFRALAQYNGSTGTGENKVNDIQSVGTLSTDKGVAVVQGTIANGKDIVWGTTAKHYGKGPNYANDQTDLRTYETGQAIPPRTGDVPIAFEHVMSKITVNLATTSDASSVDLAGAKLYITDLYTSGTVTLENGTITYTDDNKVTYSATTGLSTAAIKDLYAANETDDAKADRLKEYMVIPQSITDNSKIIVVLADGTRYTAQLNLCELSDETIVDKWVRGKHYTYTITLEKEKITFRAMIKEWDPVEGGGKATLEWD